MNRTPEPSRLAPTALAAGLPLCVYLATASGHGYWLDGGEMVAAAVDFGISHPPGHPLSGLVSGAACLVPLGSLAFRVALASAILTAAAAGFLFRALETTLRASGVPWRSVTVPLSLGGTWLVAFAHGFWFQAVRPEVYALQAMLVCLALERLSVLEARWPTFDVRPLYQASLALGLALSNHHFLGILLLPAGAATLARVLALKGRRPVLLGLGFVAVGLSTYLYLPLRAAARPFLALGQPTELDTFAWVVSAEAFQKNQGAGVPQPLGERIADVAVSLVDSIGWPTVLLAAAGLYVMLRIPGARRHGAMWGLTLLVYVAARAWLGFVRSNPDALGYLMPAMAALAVLATAFLGRALVLAGGGGLRERPRLIAPLLAVALGLCPLLLIPERAEAASLASFDATDAFDGPLRRDVPPRAVLLVHAPDTIFRYWGGEAEERLRPDVVMVPMPLLAYPGMVDGLVQEAPELREVLRGYLLAGELRQQDLQSLAMERPLLVEMDATVPPALYETLVPSGLYYAVVPEGATDTDEREAAPDRDLAWARLDHLLPDRDEPGTRTQLLWRATMDALYFAGFGDRDRARKAVARGLAIEPRATELLALRDALTDLEEEGPLDVRPFVPGGAE